MRKQSSKKLLPILIAVGAISGLISGWFFGDNMRHVYWMGEFFLASLKMIIVPLVMSSMIVGISSLGHVHKIGKTGIYTIGFYLLTTIIAVCIGILVVLLIQPGVGSQLNMHGMSPPTKVKEFGISHFIMSFVWPNVFDAMSKMQLLPLIIFSLLFGGIATTLGEKGKSVIQWVETINEIIMKMVGMILWLAPLGVFGLIAGKIGLAGGKTGMLAIFHSLGKFAAAVIFGLGIHSLIVLPILLYFVGKRSPLSYAKGVEEALITAFSTASSSATLPVTLKCTTEKNKVSKNAAQFTLPLGATINMDGTALYEAVAAIFIAQVWGISLPPMSFILIFLTATLASIGAAGIPEAGLVTMVIVLQTVGLPLEGISMILAIDWFLDRCRTTVNVWGDSIVTAMVARKVLNP